jgi:phosphoribulokinase
MPRAIVVGVVGDSGAGKTTVTRGLVRVLGDTHVTRVSADDYHRYDRRRRREQPADPAVPAGTDSALHG